MTSHSLLARRRASNSFLHGFSDSVLHTALMLGVIFLVGVALYKAVTLTVNIWRFDTVVIEGKATPLPAQHRKP